MENMFGGTMNKKMTVAYSVALIFLFSSIFLAVPNYAFVNAQISSGNTWTSKASMHEARSGLGTAVLDGKIYAIGGASDHGFCSTTEEYDIATNTWTVKASMATQRSAFGTAVWQNKIYCIGGYIPGGATGVNEVYNPATDSWETKAPMPIPSESIQANLVDGKIYVIGGIPNSTINQVYDPATDS